MRLVWGFGFSGVFLVGSIIATLPRLWFWLFSSILAISIIFIAVSFIAILKIAFWLACPSTCFFPFISKPLSPSLTLISSHSSFSVSAPA